MGRDNGVNEGLCESVLSDCRGVRNVFCMCVLCCSACVYDVMVCVLCTVVCYGVMWGGEDERDVMVCVLLLWFGVVKTSVKVSLMQWCVY